MPVLPAAICLCLKALVEVTKERKGSFEFPHFFRAMPMALP